MRLVTASSANGVCTITLSDPARRNALGSLLFEQLESAVGDAHAMAERRELIAVRLCACGPAFCAGFNLQECVDDPHTLAGFVLRLSSLTRALRAMPAVVVAQVHGPALAGGCAIVASCDIVCASEQATFGYPVHRIGVSPAVSLPTLMGSAGCGGARVLTLSGEIVDAQRAAVLGLVHRIAPDEPSLNALVGELLEELRSKGPQALRETKAWLNAIDGTGPAGQFGAAADRVASATAALCTEVESRTLLADAWRRRARTP